MPALTKRQVEVIELVTAGLQNKEIAARLAISRRAVEALLTRVYKQLDVQNRAALIAVVLSAGGLGLGSPLRGGPLVLQDPIAPEFAAYVDVPFMVAVTEGPAHRFVFVNRVAASVSGRPASNLVGRTVIEIYPEIDPTFLSALDT